MNITDRPIPQKSAKPVRGKQGSDHMARVASLPCVICYLYGLPQNSRTEVHHCKSGRYGQTKASDMETIPLCHSHHHKLRAIPGDEDKVGFHNAQETWERLYGPDYDLLPQVRQAIDDMLGEWF